MSFNYLIFSYCFVFIVDFFLVGEEVFLEKTLPAMDYLTNLEDLRGERGDSGSLLKVRTFAVDYPLLWFYVIALFLLITFGRLFVISFECPSMITDVICLNLSISISTTFWRVSFLCAVVVPLFGALSTSSMRLDSHLLVAFLTSSSSDEFPNSSNPSSLSASLAADADEESDFSYSRSTASYLFSILFCLRPGLLLPLGCSSNDSLSVSGVVESLC